MDNLKNASLAFVIFDMCILISCSEKPPAEPLFATVDEATSKPAIVKKSSIKQAQFELPSISFSPMENSIVEFTHSAGRSTEHWMPEIMGGGVVIADFNRDGAPDIVFIDGGLISNKEIESGSPQLFLSVPSGGFRNASEDWNLTGNGYGMGGVAGDMDGDGWVDLILTGWNVPIRLLKNTGDGFQDQIKPVSNIDDSSWSTSAAVLDIEGDGDLDIYVTQYINYTFNNAIECYGKQIHIYCTPQLYNGVEDLLLVNDGRGKFTSEPGRLGEKFAGKGLAVYAGDIDWDGDVDIYVANDSSRNQLLQNNGDGYYTDVGSLFGVAYSELGLEQAGMGVDVSDINNDSKRDLICTNFQGETNGLYVQASNGLFRELSDQLGIGETSRSRLSFGVDFIDIDNDGDEDLIIANGHLNESISQFRGGVSFKQKNTVFENVGGRFVDITAQVGTVMQRKQVSRGLASADIDNDGDLDVIVVNNNAAAELIYNVGKVGNFVSLWLEGKTVNSSAIGTRIVAKINERTLEREVVGGSSYLSYSGHRIHLGLGEEERIDNLLILWPDGSEQSLGPLQSGEFYRILQGSKAIAYVPGESTIPYNKTQ